MDICKPIQPRVPAYPPVLNYIFQQQNSKYGERLIPIKVTICSNELYKTIHPNRHNKARITPDWRKLLANRWTKQICGDNNKPPSFSADADDRDQWLTERMDLDILSWSPFPQASDNFFSGKKLKAIVFYNKKLGIIFS